MAERRRPAILGLRKRMRRRPGLSTPFSHPPMPRHPLTPGVFLPLLLAIGCASPRATAPDAASDAASGAASDAASGGAWTDLTDPRYWRSYGTDTFPSGWVLEDGALARTDTGEGGDIVTREAYGDFELELEWKVAPCGNSGIFYRGAEGAEYVWNTAPEMQVLDDTCHEDAQYPSHRAGAVYDLYTPSADVARPGGEWNAVRIVARGPHVEHWLNGTRIAEYEQGSDDWNARIQASKFRDEPGFGTHLSGLIGLQDHGDLVWYRNIRIRRLD